MIHMCYRAIIARHHVLEHERRRVEEEESRRIEGNTKDDITPWCRFMQWRETFKGKDLKVRSSELIIQRSLADGASYF